MSAITATRIGQSPITADWSNLGTVPTAGTQPWGAAWTRLQERFKSEIGFYQAPSDASLSQIEECERLAREVLARGNIRDCLFMGIGGSSLGPISLLSALQERTDGRIQFHFLENPDPTEWRRTLQVLKPDSTLVCIVTKSGTTFETMAQAMLALEWLGQDRWRQNVVAITDPQKGDLRKFATDHQIPTLSIAPSIGGRFSLFTPVGIFPALLAGLNVREFMQGATQVRDYIEKTPLERNALMLMGADMIRQFQRRKIHVIMPYSTPLRLLGSWFVQLWAESLGKDGKGFTPISALGATDQHSILQLLRDGPDDKVTWFMTVDKHKDPVPLPKKGAGALSRYPAFQILEGQSLAELLRIEYRAISLVLTKRSRPHLTFQLDELSERSLGALTFSLCVMTAFTGALWEVDPFDQPGVEEGKIYIRDALRAQTEESRADDDDGHSPVERLRRRQESE